MSFFMKGRMPIRIIRCDNRHQEAQVTDSEGTTVPIFDSTAQIIEFRVVTEDGVVLGPFRLPDANQLYRFEVEARARVVRFEVVDSSGGNTGAVEVAVFGEAVE